MPSPKSVFCLWALLAISSGLSGQESEGTMVGWRGDGTGKFPSATIPTTWGRVSKAMRSLHSAASRPADNAPAGAPAYWGAIQDWLVLGPFTPADPAKPLVDEFLKEADVQAAENEKPGDKAWKKVAAAGNLLNFDAEFPPSVPGSVAYAQAYLHSPAEALIEFRFEASNTLGMKAWINGQAHFDSAKPSAPRVKLAAGWNRILVKVARGDEKKQYCNDYHLSTWKFSCYFYAVDPAEWVEQNIHWVTRLPADSAASPIVAGERILLSSEPWDLVCVDRKDGRILWVRSNHFFDAMSEAERNKPELKEVQDAATRLKTINDSFSIPPGPTEPQRAEKDELQKKIAQLLAKADPKLKLPDQNNHAGHAVPTPVCDGKHVYVWYGFGLAACYDLEGKRIWIRQESDKYGNLEHGRNSSPSLAGGIMYAHIADVYGFDMRSGEVKWRYPRPDRPTHQSFLRVTANGKQAAFLGNTVLDSTGQAVCYDKQWSSLGVCPTAVIDGNRLYQIADLAGILQVGELNAEGKLSAPKTIKLFPRGASAYNKCMIIASPLCHAGLLYTVDFTGVLRVYDTQEFKLVYEKNLGCPEVRSRYHSLGAFYASPYLAGDKIYLQNLSGTTFVIAPGREFKLLAVNKLEYHENPKLYYEHPELFASSPFPAGEQLFIRGTRHLYCIEQK